MNHGNLSPSERLQAVWTRVATACQASQRSVTGVQLLAVSKTFNAEAVRQLAACRQLDFGENYVQEGVEKILALQDCSPALVWHCIGPIQRNKTRLVAEHFAWAHSIDRLSIAQRLNEQRPAALPPLNVCLQVNIDGGANKSGLAPDAALALALALLELPRLTLRGIMTIPDPVPDFATQVLIHRKARALFDHVQAALNRPQFDTLSMGMSNDLEAAIWAGSTMVRVGTAVFGERQATLAARPQARHT